MNFNMTSLGDMAGVFASISIFSFVLHLCMALAVNGDAKRMRKNNAGLFLFGPVFWGFLVLAFGLSALALYWVVHHSTLRDQRPPFDRLKQNS